jgi:hypothetical protein
MKYLIKCTVLVLVLTCMTIQAADYSIHTPDNAVRKIHVVYVENAALRSVDLADIEWNVTAFRTTETPRKMVNKEFSLPLWFSANVGWRQATGCGQQIVWRRLEICEDEFDANGVAYIGFITNQDGIDIRYLKPRKVVSR